MKTYEVKYTETGPRASCSSSEIIRANNPTNAVTTFIKKKCRFTNCPEWNAVAHSILESLTINSVREVA